MNTNNNLLASLGVGFVLGAIAIGTVVLVWNHDREPGRSAVSSAPGAGTAPPVSPGFDPAALSRPAPAVAARVDPAVTRVAARFACSCGTCGERRLDICSCETAQQERAFIQEQLRDGRSEAEAAEALSKKYGGLKS